MSSIGKDLATIRLYLKWTLEDLHKATRIPLETLKRIENGTIFEDPNENSVYVRSFVRTYARALKLDDELTTTSLDLQQKGEYHGELLEPFSDIDQKTAPHPLGSESGDSPGWHSGKPAKDREKSSENPKTDRSKADAKETTDHTETEQKQGEASRSQTSGPSDPKQPEGPKSDPPSQGRDTVDTPDSGKKDSSGGAGTPDKPGRAEKGSRQDGSTRDKSGPSESKPTASPSGATQPSAGKSTPPKRNESDIDWVKMGHQINQQTRKSPNRTIGIIGTVLLLAIGIYIIFWTDLIADQFGLPEPSESEMAQPTETDGPDQDLSLGLADASNEQESMDNEAPEEVSTLDETLYLTIYAATGRLDPVRVWSDLKPRIDPYWLEQGTAYNFEFRDTIRIRGTYGNMLLFLNGHRIDNPRQEHYNPDENSVELTRSFFSSDPEWSREQQLDLPDGIAEPDSIQIRPTFN